MIQVGVLPVVRAESAKEVFDAIEALMKGGIPIAEITMTTPNATTIIEKLLRKFGERLIVGAGTVTNISQCLEALDVGSQFIVTPILNIDIIRRCRELNVCVIGGAFTPTEILTTWQAGADAVKIFPAVAVDGPKYLQMIHQPLPNIHLVPTGGVNLENLPKFLKAGALFVGAGGDLVSPEALKIGNTELIVEKARKYRFAIQKAQNHATNPTDNN
ncbi:MAG: bifunctional 4-hydroxy-2-oxoglutarate aldolase/2-dehydro-3-deoxy-phosphogluconate aldolase [Desulfobacterales bacterium]|jgi:2-dehydro-3-deoxyphosphogluconate aldolase/(4S)-4-hydroxy-2-oxoglutarate aldolase